MLCLPRQSMADSTAMDCAGQKAPGDKPMVWMKPTLCVMVLAGTLAGFVEGTGQVQHRGTASVSATGGSDPLPSWNDTKVKQAIVAFVKTVTDKAHPDYIPPEDRIATFDNDGTLWCEMPLVELMFTLERLKALAARDPTLKEKQPFKAA